MPDVEFAGVPPHHQADGGPIAVHPAPSIPTALADEGRDEALQIAYAKRLAPTVDDAEAAAYAERSVAEETS